MHPAPTIAAISLLCLAAAPAAIAQMPWVKTLETARKFAQETDRVVMVDFGAPW